MRGITTMSLQVGFMNLLVLISAFLTSETAAEFNLNNQASMNFDQKDLVPFLVDLNAKFKFGLDARKLGNFAKSVSAETEKSIIIDFLDRGRHSKMEFGILMDDMDSPDLYMYFDSRELADFVGDFMLECAEARGM